MSNPEVVMIAGPNGAGKTSTAMTLLPNFLRFNEFVNADDIAYDLSPLDPNSVAIESGRIMLKRINQLIENRENFAFETTGSARTHLHTVERCRRSGYRCSLLFLYLSSVELALERVRLRVSQGGHNIPEKDIIRRYKRGLERVLNHYIPIMDIAEVYDNSFGEAQLVAERRSLSSGWIIYLPEIWNEIKSNSHEKSA